MRALAAGRTRDAARRAGIGAALILAGIMLAGAAKGEGRKDEGKAPEPAVTASFDWSYASPKAGEVPVADSDAGRAIRESLGDMLEHFLGYALGEPVVTMLDDTTIVRVPIFYKATGQHIGQAIRLEKGGEIREAVQVESVDQGSP